MRLQHAVYDLLTGIGARRLQRPGRLFADMEKAASAKFYRSVGSLGRLFLEIETEAFTFAN